MGHVKLYFFFFLDERLLCCTLITIHLLSLHTKNYSFSTECSRNLLLAIASLKRKRGEKKIKEFSRQLKKKKKFWFSDSQSCSEYQSLILRGSLILKQVTTVIYQGSPPRMLQLSTSKYFSPFPGTTLCFPRFHLRQLFYIQAPGSAENQDPDGLLVLWLFFHSMVSHEIQVLARRSTQEEHLMTGSDVSIPVSPFSTWQKTSTSNSFLIQHNKVFQLFQSQNKVPDFFLILSSDRHLRSLSRL